MPEFEYSLGQVVLLDPFGSQYATKGIIIGRIEWIGGGMPGYYVSARNAVGDEIKRHTVAECEISPLPLDPTQAEMPNDITVTGRYPHAGPIGEIPVGE